MFADIFFKPMLGDCGLFIVCFQASDVACSLVMDMGDTVENVESAAVGCDNPGRLFAAETDDDQFP